MAESSWRSLNQEGRWGTSTVIVTAGNLDAGRLRAKRIDDAGQQGTEEEIPADEFQAHAPYSQDWLNFFADHTVRVGGGRIRP